MSYNLLDQKWIPILWNTGKVDRVGIIEALTKAGEIRSITLASPLDSFAVHRFILTLLYWKAGLAGGVEEVRKSLLRDERVPTVVLDGIKKKRRYFDLFDDGVPFLQDPSACKVKKKEMKSVGSLFAEFASGSNIAHFHHGDDENMRLCLPCTTLGMLRVVPWTQAGGAGLTPSVHNAPPIMIIAAGDTLAITLGLNLVTLDFEAGKPKWSGHFEPTDSTKPIPYLEAFTWNPRRIFLSSPQEGTCWYCGQTNVPSVGKITYLKNKDTKRLGKNPFVWQDPSAFYLDEFKTIKSTKEELAASGRDLQHLIDADSVPQSTVALKNPSHKGWRLIVPCTNPANNKTFDHRELELESLSLDAIRALLPAGQPSGKQGLDGWQEPKIAHPKGIQRFVEAAAKLLTCTDWAALSNAAYREMHESPAAFDVLSGLYWGLRDKEIKGLPSRNAAWLMLKLIAASPPHARVLISNAKFSPLQVLPKRQLNDRGEMSPYPASLPRGRRLEVALRGALENNMRKANPSPVDWIGLCHGLDQLLD